MIDINQVKYNTFCLLHPHLKEVVDKIFTDLAQPSRYYEYHDKGRYSNPDANNLAYFFRNIGYTVTVTCADHKDPNSWKISISWLKLTLTYISFEDYQKM